MNWVIKSWKLVCGGFFAALVLSLLLYGVLTDGVRNQPPESLYFLTKSKNHKRQCNVPILYSLNENMSLEAKEYAVNAFNYWNDVFGGSLFVYAGELSYQVGSPEASAFIMVEVREKFNYYDNNDDLQRAEDVAAITSFKYNEDGCMFATGIIVFEDSLKKWGSKKIETVIRHEIGHTLGFHHSEVLEDLMYPTASLNFGQKHPKEISDWEREAFMLYYYK